MDNKTIWIIVAVIVVIGGIYFITRGPSSTDTTSTATPSTTANNTSQTTPTPAAPQGRVVFSATDAAANMGNVSQVNMQISEIDVHNATDGWVTASVTPVTFDLLALNAKKQSTLMSNITLKAATYDQVRFNIASVSIKTTAGVIKDARLPSNEMAIATSLVVNKDSTASANFDFLARSSLFTTDAGDYIFAPVVTTHTESNAKLEIATTGIVTIDSGHVDNTNTVAMDIDGSVKANFRISPTAKLAIGTDGSIKLNTTLPIK